MKIAIVHKHHVMCSQLARLLEAEGHETTWVAHDAVSALRESSAQTPDVLLWSVDIVGAVRVAALLRESTALVAMYARDQDLAEVDEALAAGAVTALNLANLNKSELRTRLATVARLRARTSQPTIGLVPLIAIGASTGGPQALAQVCSALPASFKGALVIVQHIEPGFITELATTVAARSALRVTMANEGARPERGAVYLAARAHQHLTLDAAQRFHYAEEPKAAIHRPSVDVLFESLARSWSSPGTAVLLTGMGRDGAHGMGMLRRAGWRTIAQDAQSSAVYGMPRAAVESGAASEVLGLLSIGPALLTGSLR